MPAPVIEFRSNVSAFPVLASVTLLGAGPGNAIVAGNSSTPQTIRIYNNFAGAGSISDAVNCVLASYDNIAQQSVSITDPVTQAWLQVEVLSYDGNVTGADSAYTAIGGSAKKPVPVNSGVLAGGASHYIQVSLKIVVPALGAGSAITQGLWLEYSYT
jgi:hypothetical protein